MPGSTRGTGLRGSSLLRGVGVLVAAGLIVGTLIATPGFARHVATKKWVNKNFLPKNGTAANANLLGGQPPSAFQPVSASTSLNPTDIPLTTTDQDVLTTTISLPGTRNLVVTASVNVFTASATASQADCRLRLDGANIGQTTFFNYPATSGYDNQFALVARAANVGAGNHTVAVTCGESAGSDTTFDRGDLVVHTA